MDKKAGRYASQGGIELNQGMMQTPGFGNMGRMSALFPMGNNSAIARQAQMSGMNQNPASQISAPTPGLATTQGIQQAAQKVADFSYAEGLQDFLQEKTTAKNDVLGNFVRFLSHQKHAEVTTGSQNSGGGTGTGSKSLTTSSPGKSSTSGFGTLPGKGTQSQQNQQNPSMLGQNALPGQPGGMLGGLYGQMGGMQTPLNQAQQGWSGLAPGSPVPGNTATSVNKVAMAVPGPAGLQPTP